MPYSDSIKELSLHITKTSQSNGMRRWSAVNSDTVSDLYGERMSLELYQKMIGYIKNSVPPPAQYKSMICSDFWCGGMPYVSIAHYPDLNGKAVPGETLELFVDGNQLKAKGVLFNNKLGDAVWKSLQKDEKRNPDEAPIRISIAFLDLAHKHGDDGKVWERKSTTICEDCANGKGDKIYVDGYLVHLALTRVPVNPRTRMLSEKSMAKKIQTRKEDAESILEDKALVDEIVTEALEAKSDVMVEMSDAEEPVVEEAKTKADPEPDDDPDDDSKGKKGKEDMPMHKALTAEDVVEIVKSLLPAPVVPEVVPVATPVETKSALDNSVDNLYNSINSALQTQSTVEEKLASINPALQELGQAITSTVREASGEKPVAPVSNELSQVLEAVSSLAETVKSVATEVATLKAQTNVPTNNANRVPVPRSVQPQVLASLTEAPKQVNPMSVKNIVRRSVSNLLPLE